MQDENQQPGWVFNPGTNQEPPQAPETPQAGTSSFDDNAPHITWTASEYAANPKSAGWFGILGLGAIGIAVLVYLVTKDVVSTAVIAVLAVSVGIFAARQPRVLQYALDSRGLSVGERLYTYESFKYFSVADDQALRYIQLMPLRRFMPPLTIHYDPADEDKIAETLAAYLPIEEHKRDIVDSITHRFRF